MDTKPHCIYHAKFVPMSAGIRSLDEKRWTSLAKGCEGFYSRETGYQRYPVCRVSLFSDINYECSMVRPRTSARRNRSVRRRPGVHREAYAVTHIDRRSATAAASGDLS
jgi:hypothetical protein